MKPETVLVYDSGRLTFAGKVCFIHNIEGNVYNRRIGETCMAATGRVVVLIIRSLEQGADAPAKVSAANAYLVRQERCIAPLDRDFLKADVDFIHLAKVDIRESDVDIARSLGFAASPTPEALKGQTVAFGLGKTVNWPFFWGGDGLGGNRESGYADALASKARKGTPQKLQLIGLVIDSGEPFAVFRKDRGEQAFCLRGDSFSHAGSRVTVTRISMQMVTVDRDGKAQQYAVGRIEHVPDGRARRFRARGKRLGKILGPKEAAGEVELRLIGIAVLDDRSDAIFRLSNGDRAICGENETFTDAGRTVTVIKIGEKEVTISRSGQVQKLSIE